MDLIITLIIFNCLYTSDVLCFFRFNYKLIIEDFVSFKLNFRSFTLNTNLKPNQEFEKVYLKEFEQHNFYFAQKIVDSMYCLIEKMENLLCPE